MNPENWIALGAVAIALVGAGATALFAFLNLRRERVTQRMQLVSLRQQYFANMRTWADGVSDTLSEAIHFSELDPARCADPSFFEHRNRLRIQLSSAIDKGRWFFPNLRTEEHGAHKARAFRGYRQETLNSLVHAYRSITALDYATGVNNERCRSEMVDAKKVFVSEIQSALDPHSRDREFAAITASIDAQKLARADLPKAEVSVLDARPSR